MHPLRSLRNRLALVFGLIVLGAIATVYLTTTPRLEDRLTEQKLDGLEADAQRSAGQLAQVAEGNLTKQTQTKRLATEASRSSAEVLVLKPLKGEPISTTFVEFEILLTLARSPGRVFTRDMLLARVWGDSAYRDPRTIDVHIRHLREKIERDPKEPEFLFTVRGVGYHFRDR